MKNEEDELDLPLIPEHRSNQCHHSVFPSSTARGIVMLNLTLPCTYASAHTVPLPGWRTLPTLIP